MSGSLQSGPWTKYSAASPTPAPDGPWAKYAAQPAGSKQSKQLGSRVLQGAENFGTEVAHGAMDQVVGLNQFMAHLLPVDGIDKAEDTFASQRNAGIAQDRAAKGETGPDVGRMVGQVISPVNYLPVAGEVGDIASAAGRVAQSGISGGVAGAASPVQGDDYWHKKATQIEHGILGGFGFGVAGEGVAKAITKAVRPAADALLAQGVKLTPGQAIGGVAKRAEDAMASVPIIGSAIRSGQQRSLESFNEVAINRALAPIGAKLSGAVRAGHAAIEEAAGKLGDAYNALTPKMIGKMDKPFMAEINNVRQLATNLPLNEKAQLESIIQDEVLSKFNQQSGAMTGETLKNVDSMFGSIYRPMLRSEDYTTRRMAGAVQEVQASLRRMRDRVNPGLGPQLAKVDQGYANLLRVQRAAGSVGARDGVFTPHQLLSAAKAYDPSRNKAAFAKGNAMMQGLADKAKDVLPSKIPDSGTPERAMWGILAASLAGNHEQVPGAVAGGIAALLGSSAYTAPGMRFLAKYGGPSARNYLAKLLVRSEHYGTPAAALAAQPSQER